jgi:hypothetical protein
MTLPHVILTRFNLGLYNQYAGRFPDPDQWMDRRIDLFRRLTVPSVAGQRAAEFEWLVFVDRRTPARRRAELAGLSDRFELIPADAPSPETFDTALAAFRTWLGRRPRPRGLITSRLDNDDALFPDFAASIQAAARAFGPGPAVIDAPRGYRLDLAAGRAVSLTKRLSPFLSFWEPVGDPATVRTCWARRHTRMGGMGPVIDPGGGPLWVQTAHRTNLKNTPLGGPGVEWAELAARMGLEAL